MSRILAALAALAMAAPAARAAEMASDALVPHGNATLLGPAADRQITVLLALPLRDAAGAADFVAHVMQRGDPLFRHFLTPHAFGERFGGDPARITALADWARAQGLSVGLANTGRTILPLTGSMAQVQSALGVALQDYRAADGRIFSAANRAPVLADSVSGGSAIAVLGLSGATRFAPLARIRRGGVHADATGSGFGGAYSAADLRGAYQVPPQTPAGPMETVAVFEQGGFLRNDVARYLRANQLPPADIRVRHVNGYGGAVNDPAVELEAVLDIDMVIAMNPAVQRVLVYEDGADSFGVAMLDCLAAMADDASAQTISISYGIDEAMQGPAQVEAEGVLFLQLAAQGQAVFVSAGDQGAYGRSQTGLNAPDPGAQPYVTSVGGTSLRIGARSAYYGERAWNRLDTGEGATGGGVSALWAIPSYQLSRGQSVAVSNGGSARFRNVPDVAAVADPQTGVAVYSVLNGGWVQVGGTSVSAPVWAGYFSVLDAASKGLGSGQVGFLNPALYAFATAYEGFDLHDVIGGSNGNAALFGMAGYSAGPGYDNTTGWGSPAGIGMLLDFSLGALQAGGNPPAAPEGLRGTAGASSAGLRWKASAQAGSYAVVAQNLSAAASPKLQITSGLTATLTGLTPSSHYAMTVYAVSRTGIAPATIFLNTP